MKKIQITNSKAPHDRPKIGLAFSGGTLRAISQIAILEVLEEHKIPIDYIAAASSGCISAASYACGTTDKLKDVWFNLTGKQFRSYISRKDSKGGIYNLRKMEILFRELTQNKHFEDVRPRLGFVAVDVVAGEEVLLQMGDIARAIRASCSLPGLFEPVRWGNKLLVDGGLLLDTIPVAAVQDMGADIVIGVDIADSKYVFGNYGLLIFFWKQYMLLRRTFSLKAFWKLNQQIREWFDFAPEPIIIGEETDKSWFAVLSRSLDVMIEKKYLSTVDEAKGQVLIAPKIKHHRSYNPAIVSVFYEEGRKAALAAVPRIKKLIAEYEPQ